MKYTVHAIMTGELESMPEVSLMGGGKHPDIPWEEIKPYYYRTDIVRPDGTTSEGSMVPCWVWYLEGGDKKILVDTGMGSAEEIINCQSNYGICLAANKKPEWELELGLKEYGLTPDDIDIIVISHCHFDHIANNHLFRNAKFIVQRAELPWALSPPPYGAYFYREFSHYVRDVLDRTIAIDGDYQVAPGVKMLRIGGHSPGSAATLVDTKEGRVALAGDCMYNYRNLEFNWPQGPYYRLDELMAGYQRLKMEGDIVVPQHDYHFVDLFPNRRIG